jgi:hypothetical protein
MTIVKKTTEDYKDFFEVTDFLATDIVDFTYRKTIVKEDSIFKQENEDSLVSFERFDAKKSLSIYNYLIYKLPTIEDEETKKWYKKVIRFFENTLSKINNSTSFITPNDIFICHRYEKIEYSGDKTVGRLYCFSSIQTLPREIRYFLFKDDYVDFDIVNAHPSILYLYSIKNGLVLNGTLKKYVVERSSVMSEIQQELGVELSVVKKNVLKLLNRTWEEDLEKNSKTLSQLDKDFQTIRDHLWTSYCNGHLQNYESPISKSMKRKEKMYNILPNGYIDETKLLLLKKVSLQSFYCQTQESVHLIKLVKFLRQEYKIFLKEERKNFFIDYYPSTDKRVELGAAHTLFIVPFFDGLYISSPNERFMNCLGDIVEKYNGQSNVVKFLQKEIEPRVERIPDTDELRKFTIIYEWLGKSSAKNYLDMFIQKTGLSEQVVSLLKDQFSESKIEEEHDIWEADYKLLVQKIKSNIYNILLKYPIRHDLDIQKIIKEL